MLKSNMVSEIHDDNKTRSHLDILRSRLLENNDDYEMREDKEFEKKERLQRGKIEKETGDLYDESYGRAVSVSSLYIRRAKEFDGRLLQENRMLSYTNNISKHQSIKDDLLRGSNDSTKNNHVIKNTRNVQVVTERYEETLNIHPKAKKRRKYKYLKVKNPSRRSPARQLIQEQSPDGIVISRLDNEPFPDFQLPRNRRQYEHFLGSDEGNATEMWYSEEALSDDATSNLDHVKMLTGINLDKIDEPLRTNNS